jgi:S1-C subfamily serine protease
VALAETGFSVVIAVIVMTAARPSIAKDAVIKDRERSSVSLELEFSRRRPDSFLRIVSFLVRQPNAYATGFFVGPRLVVTAYHVVSGDLSDAKKMLLGFEKTDPLDVKVFTRGCQARVLGVDKEADLALLEVCEAAGNSFVPSFQSTIGKDEKLLVIARPHGEKVVGYGTFVGIYGLNGVNYWSARLPGQDGFSGSPLYNGYGELVGVFSGYDWSQKLAVISPATRAQKLIADFASSAKP